MMRVVLFVEGHGEVEAAPALLSRLWAELPDALKGSGFVDDEPMRVGNAHKLTGPHASEWTRYLAHALSSRKQLGAVILLLDSDLIEDRGECAVEVARKLASDARNAGGGSLFSVAVVFLRKEYESLFIASYESLPGRRGDVDIPANVEAAPRDAKGWLKRNHEGGYRESVDQLALTREIRFELIRRRNVRSFQRLEHAVREVAEALSTTNHFVSPTRPT